MSRHRAAPAALSAVWGAALLTGCAVEAPTPTPTSGASSPAVPGPSATPALQDRSTEVVDAAAPLVAIATTAAKPSSSFVGSTFTFYRLTRSDSSTLLVWRITGGERAGAADANVRFWERYPVVVTGGKRYSVVTFDKQDAGWSAVSDPALRIVSGADTPPVSALYPPLPAGTTTVTLTSPWFDDVDVPVTDVA